VSLRVAYHPDYRVYLPPTHPFPMGKYPLLYERLLASGTIADADVMTPDETPLDWLERVHDRDYLERVATGTLTAAEVRKLGVPWSAHLWRRSRLAVHGTYLAARAALAGGLAGNLAGGTHHAYPDHGEGFCVLNDVAIAVRQLRAEGAIGRVLIVDLDVHQGNGTAAIFADDPDTYTLSLHGERNYPIAKERSSLDVGLPDDLDDAGYLAALREALPRAIEESGVARSGAGVHAARADAAAAPARADVAAAPVLAFYLGGVDVAAGDRYGRFRLSDDGIRARDAWALDALRNAGIPVALTLAGGYAPTPLRTAELHSYAFEAAVRRLRAEQAS
jgi:acetoin utilization deacetylase AcuC-like enzyme